MYKKQGTNGKNKRQTSFKSTKLTCWMGGLTKYVQQQTLPQGPI